MPEATADASRVLDEQWMGVALRQAFIARQRGDWPFGAAIVRDGRVIAAAPSAETLHSTVTSHAEINAIRAAGTALGSPNLPGAWLYTTHEPCGMCLYAALHSEVARIVVGSRRADRPDLFRPHAITLEHILADAQRQPEVVFGCRREEALALFAPIRATTRISLSGIANRPRLMNHWPAAVLVDASDVLRQFARRAVSTPAGTT
jgi:tRNA(adenine34) deaminase